jgi:hypothetical protein
MILWLHRRLLATGERVCQQIDLLRTRRSRRGPAPDYAAEFSSWPCRGRRSPRVKASKVHGNAEEAVRHALNTIHPQNKSGNPQVGFWTRAEG